MTDRAKFEQMLEYLINEDKAKAEEIFHELVVAKSREIYENLLDDDIQVDEETDEDEDEDEVEENFDYGLEEVGGDPADDMMNAMSAGDDDGDDGMGDMGDDDGMGGDEPATKDDVSDIKDALEELKAEFEAMLSGGKTDDTDDMDDMPSMDDDEDDEDGDDEDEDETKESFDDGEFVREYVEKVGAAKMGDHGANTKSIVAGKNDMGGTTANIVRGGTSETGGTKGGLANPSTKEDNAGNMNVPGANAGKTAFKKREPGHGAEKKGTGDMGDKSAQSPLNGAPKRAK